MATETRIYGHCEFCGTDETETWDACHRCGSPLTSKDDAAVGNVPEAARTAAPWWYEVCGCGCARWAHVSGQGWCFTGSHPSAGLPRCGCARFAEVAVVDLGAARAQRAGPAKWEVA